MCCVYSEVDVRGISTRVTCVTDTVQVNVVHSVVTDEAYNVL